MVLAAERNYREAERRRAEFEHCVRAGFPIKEACSTVGVSERTYAQWRADHPDFRARIDVARAEFRAEREQLLDGAASTRLDRDWIRGFIDFRAKWPRHSTPWFQAEVMSHLHEATPGDIILVLFPPEHGKTRLFEDYATHTIVHNPNWMSHVGSESIALSKKILSAVMRRLDPIAGSPWQLFARSYGPFAPKGKNDGGHRQPWTTTHFDVFRKAHFDDRDYTMAALGFGSQIIGSRSLHLHCDDLQSMKTLSQTQSYMDEWRQDWLSRPGETGITTVFGNRIDEGDIYEAMIEELPDSVLRVIRYPAVLERNGKVEPLWPERWPMEKLRRAEIKAGPAVWERNWMQRPRAKKLKTFTDEIVGKALNPNLTLKDPLADRRDGRVGCYMALDPSIGGRTCVSVWTAAPKMRLVWAREEIGLTSNHAIAQTCREGLLAGRLYGFRVSDLIVESMAFQKGLLEDRSFIELRDDFGCAIRPHLTGLNKLDSNIGIPSMVTDFLREQIEIPYAADELTRLYADMLKAELLSWRPMKRGTELIQDLMMTLWFAWLLWRTRRGEEIAESRGGEAFRSTPMPLGPLSSGLIIPPGAYPSIMTGVQRGSSRGP